MERSGKTGLRGELRIERYMGERQFAGRQFRHRALQPKAADVTVRRDTHGERELTRKMKEAVTRDAGKIEQRDVVLDVCRDIVENAAKPNMIETMRGSADARADPAIAMLVKEPGRKRERGCFDVQAACGRLDVELGEH